MNRRKKKGNGLYAFLYLAPSLIGVSIFVLVPFADAIRRSFLSAMGDQFVGLANFREVLSNEAFLLASKNTARFMGICIPLLMVLSLLISVSLMHLKKYKERFKVCFLIPVAIPVASIVFLWKVLFARFGILNGILVKLYINPIDFMESDSAFYVLLFTYLWKNIGYDMVLWLSGLSNISKDLYEAAQLDGAGPISQFFYITLPSLRATTLLVAVISLINAFKVFREAYLISGSYPHENIYMLQHIFNNWFLSLDIQKMCSGAVLMATAVILVLSVLMKMSSIRSR